LTDSARERILPVTRNLVSVARKGRKQGRRHGPHRGRDQVLLEEEEEAGMYKQVFDPIGDSLFVSSLFAMLPLLTLFVLLGGLRACPNSRSVRAV